MPEYFALHLNAIRPKKQNIHTKQMKDISLHLVNLILLKWVGNKIQYLHTLNKKNKTIVKQYQNTMFSPRIHFGFKF